MSEVNEEKNMAVPPDETGDELPTHFCNDCPAWMTCTDAEFAAHVATVHRKVSPSLSQKLGDLTTSQLPDRQRLQVLIHLVKELADKTDA